MCRQTYHHYPSCGHIANWTMDSCIEFTNSLRGLFIGQIASCPRTEATHDLLPLTHPTFCLQCEREWKMEFTQNGTLKNHPTLAHRNLSIEGLGSTVPAIEVQVRSSLGLSIGQFVPQPQPVIHEVEADDRIDLRQDFISANPTVNAGYRKRTPPLPPPRLGRFCQQEKPQLMRRKNPPEPIIANPQSYFDPMTPSTSSGGTIPKTHTPSNPKFIELWSDSPVIKFHGIYNWVPVPTAKGAFSLPTASSAYPSPTSYSALERALDSTDSVSSSPLLSLPPPEEYMSFAMTPGNKRQVIDNRQPAVDSFRNGLCIAFPHIFTSLWAKSQKDPFTSEAEVTQYPTTKALGLPTQMLDTAHIFSPTRDQPRQYTVTPTSRPRSNSDIPHRPKNDAGSTIPHLNPMKSDIIDKATPPNCPVTSTNMSKPSIGFVGLGAMGFGMATHLVKEGYPVHGFDVFAASVDRFKAAGGIAASSLRESAEGKDYYVCMVASAPQVQTVLFGEGGIVQALPKNATLLLCSTVAASYAQAVASELQAKGRSDIKLIDSPVSGGAKRAADGTLSIMAGGSDEALGSGRFLLQAMSDSNKLYLVPGGVGAGSDMKMVHQVLAGIHILGASEVMGFAARLGLNAPQTAEKLQASEAWTWMHENRLPRMLAEDWNPGASALTIILKDVGIITSSARLVHFPTPLSSTAEQIYLAALSQGYASKDDSAMVRQYYPDPITQVSSSSSSAEDTAAAYQLVQELMLGINLCAAAEAVSLARYLKADLSQFYTLVSDAAGGSRVFVKQGLEMIEERIGAKAPTGSRTVDEAVEVLEKVVQKARDLNCPLHLGNAALNLLLLAKRAGYGKEGSTSVVKVFG